MNAPLVMPFDGRRLRLTVVRPGSVTWALLPGGDGDASPLLSGFADRAFADELSVVADAVRACQPDAGDD